MATVGFLMHDAVHAHAADVSFDGGDLDCGNGLLLLIRRHIDPMNRGQLLEILSTETSVREDLPAWCRMTGNELVSVGARANAASYLVCKGALSERIERANTVAVVATRQQIAAVQIPARLPEPRPAPVIPALAVMGMGSWPRPRWMVQAVHERMQGRLSEAEFEATADDAVRLAVQAQLRAG